MVLRRPQFVEIGKVVRRADKLRIQIDISFFGQGYDAYPHAVAAGIDQIEIVESSVGIDRLRLEMVEFKLARDLAPRFSFQAIDTAKFKLVAKPWTVALVRIPIQIQATFASALSVSPSRIEAASNSSAA